VTGLSKLGLQCTAKCVRNILISRQLVFYLRHLAVKSAILTNLTNFVIPALGRRHSHDSGLA